MSTVEKFTASVRVMREQDREALIDGIKRWPEAMTDQFANFYSGWLVTAIRAFEAVDADLDLARKYRCPDCAWSKDEDGDAVAPCARHGGLAAPSPTPLPKQCEYATRRADRGLDYCQEPVDHDLFKVPHRDRNDDDHLPHLWFLPGSTIDAERQRADRAEAEIARLHEEMRARDKGLARLSAENAKFRAEATRATDEVGVLRDKLEKALTRAIDAECREDKLTAELASARTRCTELAAQVREAEAERDEAKRVSASAQAQTVEVAKGYNRHLAGLQVDVPRLREKVERLTRRVNDQRTAGKRLDRAHRLLLQTHGNCRNLGSQFADMRDRAFKAEADARQAREALAAADCGAREPDPCRNADRCTTCYAHALSVSLEAERLNLRAIFDRTFKAEGRADAAEERAQRAEQGHKNALATAETWREMREAAEAERDAQATEKVQAIAFYVEAKERTEKAEDDARSARRALAMKGRQFDTLATRNDRLQADLAAAREEADRLKAENTKLRERGDEACDRCRNDAQEAVAAAEKRAAVAEAKTELQQERARLAEGRLPDGMKHCTILFKECEKGHGWLTAANWVQHPCPTCDREKRAEQAEADVSMLSAVRETLLEAGFTVPDGGHVPFHLRKWLETLTQSKPAPPPAAVVQRCTTHDQELVCLGCHTHDLQATPAAPGEPAPLPYPDIHVAVGPEAVDEQLRCEGKPGCFEARCSEHGCEFSPVDGRCDGCGCGRGAPTGDAPPPRSVLTPVSQAEFDALPVPSAEDMQRSLDAGNPWSPLTREHARAEIAALEAKGDAPPLDPLSIERAKAALASLVSRTQLDEGRAPRPRRDEDGWPRCPACDEPMFYHAPNGGPFPWTEGTIYACKDPRCRYAHGLGGDAPPPVPRTLGDVIRADNQRNEIVRGAFTTALETAEGCHDFGGGYRGGPGEEAYHHGIATVVNVLRDLRDGRCDYSMQVLQAKGVEDLAKKAEAGGKALPEPDVLKRTPNLTEADYRQIDREVDEASRDFAKVRRAVEAGEALPSPARPVLNVVPCVREALTEASEALVYLRDRCDAHVPIKAWDREVAHRARRKVEYAISALNAHGIPAAAVAPSEAMHCADCDDPECKRPSGEGVAPSVEDLLREASGIDTSGIEDLSIALTVCGDGFAATVREYNDPYSRVYRGATLQAALTALLESERGKS